MDENVTSRLPILNASLNLTLQELTNGYQTMNNLMMQELESQDKMKGALMIQNKKVIECGCWQSEEMKKFMDVMKSHYEDPLLLQLEKMTEVNKKLRLELEANRGLIFDHENPDNQSDLNEIKKELSDKMMEIDSLNKKLDQQKIQIEEYIQIEDEYFQKNQNQSKGYYLIVRDNQEFILN